MAYIVQQARIACNFPVSYHQLQRWIMYYQQYGTTEAESRRYRQRRTIRGIRASKPRQFTAQHESILKELVANNPQLYLDELQLELVGSTGRLWSTSTIWSHLQNIGYTLRKTVFRASQQLEQEVNDIPRTWTSRRTSTMESVDILGFLMRGSALLSSKYFLLRRETWTARQRLGTHWCRLRRKNASGSPYFVSLPSFW